MILAGGGNAEQSQLVDEFFLQFLPREKFLFIPHAVAPKLWNYERALEWIHKPKAFQDIEIVMWEDISGKTLEDLGDFDAIYLMGGNTYELLHQLRESNFLELIPQFLDTNRIVYGISAGAYVLGKDITDRIPPEDEDKNKIGLKDLSSLNLLQNYNIHCHYISEHDEALLEFEKEYKIPLLAIPERSGIHADGESYTALGYEPVCIFREDGDKEVIEPDTTFSLK